MGETIVQEKEFDLKNISQLGLIEKTKEILKGLSITLRSLTSSYQHKVLAGLPPESLDAFARYSALQVETLVYATLNINGKKYDDINRVELRPLYSQMQNKVLQEVYALYLEISKEQDEVIQSLKKT